MKKIVISLLIAAAAMATTPVFANPVPVNLTLVNNTTLTQVGMDQYQQILNKAGAVVVGTGFSLETCMENLLASKSIIGIGGAITLPVLTTDYVCMHFQNATTPSSDTFTAEPVATLNTNATQSIIRIGTPDDIGRPEIRN